MNRWICAAAACIFCFLLTAATAGGAATAVYTTKAPAYEMMLVTDNGGVGVDQESVHFDFSSFSTQDASFSSQITADYQMSNRSGEEKTVSVALPVVTDLLSLQEKEISFQVNGQEHYYSLFAGDTTEQFDGSLNSLINSLNYAQTQGMDLKSDAFWNEGDAYAVTVQPRDNSFELVVTMNVDLQKCKLVYYGFRACQYDGIRTVRLSATISKDHSVPLGFAVWGEKSGRSQPVISYYTDAKKTTSLPDQGAFFTEQQTDLSRLIWDAIKQYSNANPDNFSDNFSLKSFYSSPQPYKLVASMIDEALEKENCISLEQNISACYSMERLVFLFYTFPFEKGETKQVSLQYETEGTIDQRSTAQPLYHYEYKMETANKWPFFDQLSLSITPPADAPYVIESDPSFTKQEDGSYLAELSSVPKEDVVFSIHASETISNIKGPNGNSFSVSKIVLYLFLILLGVSIVHFVILILKGRSRKMKHHKNDS